jgi:Tfp pilus assembly protein PilE
MSFGLWEIVIALAVIGVPMAIAYRLGYQNGYRKATEKGRTR